MAGTSSRNGKSPADRRQAAMVAIAWFVRMRAADRTPEDERRFRAWLEEDPGHVAVYAGIEAAWDTAGDTAGELHTVPGFQVMRQEALRPRTGFLRFAGQGRGLAGALTFPADRMARRFAAAAAAAAAVALLTVTGLSLQEAATVPDWQRIHVYETAAGQRHEFTLIDGSRVTLTSDSRLKMRYCDQQRLVLLERGEAYFRVAHDAKRPFRVKAGSGVVTALGTEFDVHKKNGEIAVILVNGSVEISALKTPETGSRSRRLNPGEQISYDEGGFSAVENVDAQRAVAWHTGRISVVDKPLLDVIDEMNRHSARMLKVDRSDPRLKELQVTGQFRTGRPELLVQYIKAAGIEIWEPLPDGRGNLVLRLRHRHARL